MRAGGGQVQPVTGLQGPGTLRQGLFDLGRRLRGTQRETVGASGTVSYTHLELDLLSARILIVDDQAANVKLLTRLLQEAGYTQVNATQQPTEVCALHRRNDYDLILLDLQMPGMDGFAVMRCV